MKTLIQDLWHGLRQLLRSPTFAGLLVISLGIGIAMNVAASGSVDGRFISMNNPATAADAEAAARLAASVDRRVGCVIVGVMGVHTSVAFRHTGRSSEIGVRVAVGEPATDSCA